MLLLKALLLKLLSSLVIWILIVLGEAFSLLGMTLLEVLARLVRQLHLLLLQQVVLIGNHLLLGHHLLLVEIHLHLLFVVCSLAIRDIRLRGSHVDLSHLLVLNCVACGELRLVIRVWRGLSHVLEWRLVLLDLTRMDRWHGSGVWYQGRWAPS